MSIALVTLAFKAPLASTAKFVLVALCDSANDQGECYPSVKSVAEKCSLGERTVQAALTQLEGSGYVRREFRIGRSTTYWIDANPRSSRTPAAAAPPQQPHPTPAVAAPPISGAIASGPPQQPHPRGAVAAGGGAAAAPITVTQPLEEPKKKKERASAPALAAPDGVNEQVWADWLTLRKAKKAPVTQTVMDGAQSEARKAGLTLEEFLRVWCQRGTQGLEASWLKSHERGNGAARAEPPEPEWRRLQRERNEQALGPYAAKRGPATTTPETFDVAARFVD